MCLQNVAANASFSKDNMTRHPTNKNAFSASNAVNGRHLNNHHEDQQVSTENVKRYYVTK